jgi:hypothetical protein
MTIAIPMIIFKKGVSTQKETVLKGLIFFENVCYSVYIFAHIDRASIHSTMPSRMNGGEKNKQKRSKIAQNFIVIMAQLFLMRVCKEFPSVSVLIFYSRKKGIRTTNSIICSAKYTHTKLQIYILNNKIFSVFCHATNVFFVQIYLIINRTR